MNRTELQQVIINLIANATNAMPTGGNITMAVDDDRESAPPGSSSGCATREQEWMVGHDAHL